MEVEPLAIMRSFQQYDLWQIGFIPWPLCAEKEVGAYFITQKNL